LFGVAAHEQNPGARMKSLKFSRQLAAAHSGHDDIRQKQIDRP
jgi:hypothetical protein